MLTTWVECWEGTKSVAMLLINYNVVMCVVTESLSKVNLHAFKQLLFTKCKVSGTQTLHEWQTFSVQEKIPNFFSLATGNINILEWLSARLRYRTLADGDDIGARNGIY